MTRATALKASIKKPETLKNYHRRKKADLKIALNPLIFSKTYIFSYVQQLVFLILLKMRGKVAFSIEFCFTLDF